VHIPQKLQKLGLVLFIYHGAHLELIEFLALSVIISFRQVIIPKHSFKLMPTHLLYLDASDTLHIFPPNILFPFETEDSYPGFHIL